VRSSLSPHLPDGIGQAVELGAEPLGKGGAGEALTLADADLLHGEGVAGRDRNE